MTVATPRRIDGQVPVFGSDGRQVASVNPARSVWLDRLLAECDHGHVYVLPDDDLLIEACPRCRVMGLE